MRNLDAILSGHRWTLRFRMDYAFSFPMNLQIRRREMVESVLPRPSPLPLGEGVAVACLDDLNSVVANPAAGRFRGSRHELLGVRGRLTPALSRWERGDRAPFF